MSSLLMNRWFRRVSPCFVAVVVAISVSSLCWSVEGAKSYVVDGKTSTLFVQVFRGGLFSGLAHDHVIAARDLSGSVVIDSNDHTCRVSLKVSVKNLVVDADADRRAVGYEGTLSSKDRAEIREHMLNEDQLFAERYPDIRFVSTKCEKRANLWFLAGDLEVRGKKKSIEPEFQVKWTAGDLFAEGKFEAGHGDFGMEPYSAALGTIANQDGLRFAFKVQARSFGGESPSEGAPEGSGDPQEAQ
jgi:polyisoprenoid-binding protein YceI